VYLPAVRAEAARVQVYNAVLNLHGAEEPEMQQQVAAVGHR
jgi:hypothetical protein